MRENELQNQIIKSLRALYGRYAVMRLNAGNIYINGRCIKMGIAGTPDLMLLLDKTVLFIEIKTDKGQLSLPQVRFHEWLREHGYRVIVARKLDDVINYINSMRKEKVK